MKINKYTTVLVRDRTITYNAEAADRPDVVKGILTKLFHADRLPTERVWELCINSKLEAIGAFEIGFGDMIACSADPASVARNALLTGAYGVILAHNHPSGNPMPSADDIAVTKQVSAALKLLGMELMDHIIIAQKGYYSFKENGLL